MLKIKEGINLKILEKFGFELNKNEENKNPYYNSRGCWVWCKDRVIESNCIYDQTTFAYNTIFDLIQAGLVERLYDLYENKNLTIEELRQGYREITGLDNDNELNDKELYEYMLEALKEVSND